MSVAAFTMMAAVIKLLADHGVGLIEQLFWRQAAAVPFILAYASAGPGIGIGIIKTTNLSLHIRRSAVGLLSMAFMFAGLTMLPLAEAAILSFTTPIFAVIFAAFVLREPVGWHRWGAVFLGFLGVILMVNGGRAHFPVTGSLVALVAAMLSAYVLVLVRDMSKTEAPAATTFWFAMLSAVPLGILQPVYAHGHDLLTYGLLLALGALGAIGQLGMTSSLRFAPVSTVVAVDYSGLIWSTLLGLWLWNVWPTSAALYGAPIIIFSGLYIAWREHVGSANIRSSASLPV